MSMHYPNSGHPIPVNCPPGLEFLLSLDQLLVHEKVKGLFERKNHFSIKNNNGIEIYHAIENKDRTTIFGHIQLFDNTNREIIHYLQNLRVSSENRTLEVKTPQGNIIGYVFLKQEFSNCCIQIANSNAQCIFRIDCPSITSSLGNDVNFNIFTNDRAHQIGQITKVWGGIMQEAFTDADNFRISFPINLDVNLKAVVLGACFLIDLTFFESDSNQPDW